MSMFYLVLLTLYCIENFQTNSTLSQNKSSEKHTRVPRSAIERYVCVYDYFNGLFEFSGYSNERMFSRRN